MKQPASPMQAALERLVTTLLEEQETIRRLDWTRLAAVAATKDDLAAELRTLGADQVAGARAGTAGPALRVLAARAQALAHANRLLLEEVTSMMGRRAGIADAGTYDARARRRSAARGYPGRAF